MNNQPVILFDGVCNFCNSAVNFVIRRDAKSVFKFAPLQSEAAHRLLSGFPSPPASLSSFILIENNKLYTRSSAVLRVCGRLSGLWPLVYGFIIIPKFIRDGVYNWIAKNRYRWFGKKEQCMIPSPGIRARFINI